MSSAVAFTTPVAAAVPVVAQDAMSTTPPLKRKTCDVVDKVSTSKRVCSALTTCPRRGASLTTSAGRKIGSFTAKALYSTTAPLRWALSHSYTRTSALKDAKREEQKDASAGNNAAPAAAAAAQVAASAEPAPAPAAPAKEVKVEKKTVEIQVEAAVVAVEAPAAPAAVQPECLEGDKKEDMFAAAFQEEQSAMAVEKPAKAPREKKGGNKKSKKAAPATTSFDNQAIMEAGA